ncbi:beta-1,3-galactosyltransferase 5-like [Acropora palmata]|uniref:beta-1,3-galactosyltransferase 5-like n=1 Tax=Acropora palmata TaxID=6131 RepID=UPI003DA0787D
MNQEIVSVQHRSSLTTRTACQQHYFLLILVASAPAYFDRRRDIRQTWASDSSINPRWKTIFMLGQTRNSNHSKQLLREEAYYGDLIRADYFEDYWNQTLKIEMGFEWAAKYCNFTFLLKADDDVFVNTPALLSLLDNTKTPKTGLYLGHLYKHPRVQRKGKWLVTQEEYNETHYPDFCAGPGYILSQDVIVSFVNIFNNISKFRIDDVYVGMLAKEAGVIPRHHAGFQTPPYVSRTCVLLTDTVVRHSAVGSCLRDLFRKAMPALNATAVKN